MSSQEKPPFQTYQEYTPVGWREHSLEEQYPHLSPLSEIGSTAIDLCQDVNATTDRLNELHLEHEPATSDEINEVRFTEATVRYATLRFAAFYALYDQISDWVDSTTYTEAVITSCQIVTDAISSDDRLSELMKKDLNELVNNLGMFYQVESDKHFRRADA